MDAGAPQQPDDNSTPRRRARLAAWAEVAGVILAIATVICSLLGVLSAQQAVALGLPAVLLIAGGLIAAAAPDPSTGRRLGFQAGLWAGALLSLCRSLFRCRGSGSLAAITSRDLTPARFTGGRPTRCAACRAARCPAC
jgi:hypothetical protein